jgi:hypothetical protein
MNIQCSHSVGLWSCCVRSQTNREHPLLMFPLSLLGLYYCLLQHLADSVPVSACVTPPTSWPPPNCFLKSLVLGNTQDLCPEHYLHGFFLFLLFSFLNLSLSECISNFTIQFLLCCITSLPLSLHCGFPSFFSLSVLKSLYFDVSIFMSQCLCLTVIISSVCLFSNYVLQSESKR